MTLEENKQRELFTQLFSDQALALVWFTPVFTSTQSANLLPDDFQVDYCNEAACRLLNLDLSDAVGVRVLTSELMDATSRTQIYEQCAQVFCTGDPFMFTYHSPAMDRWFVVQRTKLMGGVLSIIQDKTTEIKLQREAQLQDNKIKEQARILDLILNSSVSGVYLLEAMYESDEITDFTIIHVNEVLCRMAGKSRHDFVGKLFSSTFPDAVKQGLFERNAQVLRTGLEYKNAFHFVGDGLDRWYETSVCKATENMLVISFNDITDLKLATLKLEDVNRNLEESNRRLTDFTQFVSHDLKTPLRKMALYNELLSKKLKDCNDPDVITYLQKVESLTTRMDVLIHDLLLFSETDHHPGSFEVIPLNEIISEVRRDLETTSTQTEVIFSVGKLPEVKGDRTLLTQVFQNLVSNSIKFKQQNTEASIRIEHAGGIMKNGFAYNMVQITDNGIGFEQSYAEKIFEPFQRLNNSNASEGSGVGLAIVKRVIEKHNGLIEANSKPKEGTIFTLFFPTI